MENKDIFDSILRGTAILITGSGAHLDVETPNGDKLPSGIMLAEKLYELCGINDPENKYDLQDASETYLERFSAFDLIQEIKKQLRVGKIQKEHEELYSFNWQRVYTTNYDEVPLIATSKKEHKSMLMPITLKTPRFKKDLEKKLCIYINGYVEKLTEQSINDEFKLTGKSYLTSEGLKESVWGAVFDEDLETADCIVIIGLSLDYDLDFKRFIFNKNVSNKTVFIESSEAKEDKRRKLERLGNVKTIGMKAFVQEASAYVSKYSKSMGKDSYYKYKAFDIFEPKRPIRSASVIDVYDFFMSGQIKDSLWYREKGKYNSLIFRKRLRDVIRCLDEGIRVVYLHANLGNGKTIFIESLKHQLQGKGIKFFTLKEDFEGIMGKDIKQIISEKGRKIIIIENYYNFFSVIKQFCMYDLANVQFILSARTVLYDTRILEVNDLLKIGEGESITFDINKLSKEELKQMQMIIDRNGLWGDKSNRSLSEKRQLLSGKKTGNCELQGIMLLLVNSTNIREKINNVVNNIKRMSENYFDVLVLALLIKTMSLTINANDMSKMLNMKIALDTNFIENPNVKEILEFSSGTAEFRLRSAVIAKAILQELECNETIIAVLSKVARYADPYSEIEKYENILKNIISYSHVKTFLINTKQKQAILLNYYNELKELKYYKKN